jgi:hypothetical protein
MEAVCFSETLIPTFKFTRRRNLEVIYTMRTADLLKWRISEYLSAIPEEILRNVMLDFTRFVAVEGSLLLSVSISEVK